MTDSPSSGALRELLSRVGAEGKTFGPASEELCQRAPTIAAELIEVRADLARSEQVESDAIQGMQQCAAKLEDAERKLAEMAEVADEALSTYASHRFSCRSRYRSESCTCGLQEVRDRIATLSATAGGEMVDAIDDLANRFAAALKAKLHAAEEKYGHNDAWKADDWRDSLIRQLHEHLKKGDPRDVAAYCAFAWHHGWALEAPKDRFNEGVKYGRGEDRDYG